jgi:pyruvate ferredoxin oxidoreductase delta subunit
MLREGAVVTEAGSSVNNKTGTWRTFKPVKVPGKCAACGQCEWFCPDRAINVRMVKGKKELEIDYDHCKGCLICVNVCPRGALKAEREK